MTHALKKYHLDGLDNAQIWLVHYTILCPTNVCSDGRVAHYTSGGETMAQSVQHSQVQLERPPCI